MPPFRRLVVAGAACLLALPCGCAHKHADVETGSHLWADVSNRENQWKELVLRYQEATRRIDEYAVEMGKVEARLKEKKEALAAKRAELARTQGELAAATKDSDEAQAAAAAARQRAADAKRGAEEATKEEAGEDRRKTEIAARLEEKRRELKALDEQEADLKRRLAAAVDRAVVLRESTSGASPRVVRLTLNSVRRDGIVSVVAKGSDKLIVGDVAEVRRAGELVGKLTLIDEVLSAPTSSDAPAIYSARFEADREGLVPFLTDEIVCAPPDR
ncbi:MAG TPA: hypothetical protein VEI02_11025 [Planctomycetota bacterium]|nr:hypothetical protein [Planctomycetota bacterium]